MAGGGFHSYHIHKGNKSDKERKIVRKRLSFMHTKIFNTFFKRWVQFRVDAIPVLPYKCSKDKNEVIITVSLTKVKHLMP